jgi:hypothetical protein
MITTLVVWSLIACSQPLPNAASVPQSPSLEIQLVDGSVFKGNVISFEGGVYQFQTMLGVLSVPAATVQRIDNTGAQGALASRTAPAVSAPPAPDAAPVPEATPKPAGFLSQISTFRQSLVSNPASLDAIMSLSADTSIMGIAQDPEVMALIQSGDLRALQQHPKIIALMEEPGIVQLLDTVAP